MNEYVLLIYANTKVYVYVCISVDVYSLSPAWLCNPLDSSSPGSSVHGVSQARILEQVAISFLQGIFLTPGIQPASPALAGGLFNTATREAHMYIYMYMF